MKKKIVTPFEGMTSDQIDDAVARYRAMLEKHAREFESNTVEKVLHQSSLVEEQINVVRRYVEMMGKINVRCVNVNRSRTPQKALRATRRELFTDMKAMGTIPRGEGDEVLVAMFKLRPWEYTKPGWISNGDLEKAFARRGISCDDPFAVIVVNENEPTFADEHPHCTFWRDRESGKLYYAKFSLSRGCRIIDLGECTSGWKGVDELEFSGVLK